MKKVIIYCRSDLSREPRFLKQVNALKSEYKIVSYGLHDSGIHGIDFMDLNEYNEFNRPIAFHLEYPLFIRKIISVFVLIYLKSKDFFSPERQLDFINVALARHIILQEPDFVIGHHLQSLPLLVYLKRKSGCRIACNAHEYYPEESGAVEFILKIRPAYLYLCRKYLGKLDVFFNSCESFASKYFDNFKVPSVITYNTPAYYDLKPAPVRDNAEIKLIHHGIAIPERLIENMFEMMKIAGNRHTLDLMLIPTNKKYYDFLIDLARGYVNVRIISPVKFNQIIPALTNYDIGICYLPNNNFNNEFSLPNKLFDYIQARLCVLSAPSFEVKRIIRKEKIGFFSDDFSPQSMGKLLSRITLTEIENCKNNSHRVAQFYSSSMTEKTILDTVKKVMK